MKSFAITVAAVLVGIILADQVMRAVHKNKRAKAYTPSTVAAAPTTTATTTV